MSYERAVAFLIERGVGVAGHSSRSLLRHLEGIYNLLRSWKSTADVCYGGLFHSIYGTNFYLQECVGLKERPAVRSVVGRRAERLAYLYCVTDFRFMLHEFSAEAIPSSRPDAAPNSLKVNVLTRLGLLEIALANLLEQVPYIDPELDFGHFGPRLC